MQKIHRLLRKPVSRSLFFSNVRSRQPNEEAIPLYSTEQYPLFLQARSDNNEITMMKENKSISDYMVERLPYIVLPHFSGNSVNVVLNMEFYRESKILKLTCLDPRKLFYLEINYKTTEFEK